MPRPRARSRRACGRRLALARLSLAERQRLWLLDEPFDALDDEGVATLSGQLYAHRARGGGCILSSHLPLRFDSLPQLEHWLAPAEVRA